MPYNQQPTLTSLALDHTGKYWPSVIKFLSDLAALGPYCHDLAPTYFLVLPSTLLVRGLGSRGGLMVRVLDSGSSGPGSGPGWGHCVVFLGKTIKSPPRCINGYRRNAGDNPAMD